MEQLIHIRIDTESHKRLKIEAAERRISVTQLMREIITGYFFESKRVTT